MATVGERLRKLRKAKGFSIRKAADDLKVNKNTLSKYERNKRKPKSDFIDKASTYYNVSTDYILGKTDFKNSDINLPDNIITDMKWLPVLGTIPAGKPVLAQKI